MAPVSAMSLILAINPGATSTKVGLFDDANCVAHQSVQHTFEELPSLVQQLPIRGTFVEAFVTNNLPPGSRLGAVVGRGGLLPPMPAGVYGVSPEMVQFLAEAPRGSHASNLGAPLAATIAQAHNVPAFVVDPVTTDELEPLARVSGLNPIERHSVCHALNIRAMAHRYAREAGRPLAELRLVVVHLGSGTSMAAMLDSKMIDVVNPLDEGPMGLDRPGTLPTHALLELCLPNGMHRAAPREELESQLLGNGGLYSYLKTRDFRDILTRVDAGDEEAKMLVDAFVYDTAKWIGAMATVLQGQVDAIILTGGVAHAKPVIDSLRSRVEWIAPVVVYPGEDELKAMVEGVLRVLQGEEAAHTFQFV